MLCGYVQAQDADFTGIVDGIFLDNFVGDDNAFLFTTGSHSFANVDTAGTNVTAQGATTFQNAWSTAMSTLVQAVRQGQAIGSLVAANTGQAQPTQSQYLNIGMDEAVNSTVSTGALTGSYGNEKPGA